MSQIDLDKFREEVFKNIAPMGNPITRGKFIDIIDELKGAREELLKFKGLNEGVTKVELEKWLFEALKVMEQVSRRDISLLELNIARSRIELSMKSHGVTFPEKEEK